jgi:hypothetical protein
MGHGITTSKQPLRWNEAKREIETAGRKAGLNSRSALRRRATIRVTEGDARLAEIVRRHLDIHAVAHADADEMLAHLAGDMGKNFVPVGQGHAKHGSRQHLGNRASQFNGFFFSHENDA